MDEFFKMDVFFLITSVVTVGVGILVSLVLYRLYRILGTIEHFTKQVSEEADMLREDIREARGAIKRGGFKIKHIMLLFSRFTSRVRSKSAQPK